MIDSGDAFIFADETPQDTKPQPVAWKILITDDDEEVHHVTKLVVGDLHVLNRPIQFYSAFSVKETIEVLKKETDMAMILLDVVMEEDNSGLMLVKYIREQMHNSFIRIVLRTGQPGSAPEEKVILEYDINDYKSKTELTAQKLRTTVISSIRSYHDIISLDQNRQGLKKIIEGAPGMFELQPLKKFVSGTLLQITSLLNANGSSLYYRPAGITASRTDEDFIVLAGTGKHEAEVSKRLQDVVSEEVFLEIEQSIALKKSRFFEQNFIGFFESKTGGQNIIFFEDVPPLGPLDIELVNIFFMNMAVAFDNIMLNDEIEETQKELFVTLGEFVERRSHETGNHVKRVAEYAKYLGICKGLTGTEIDILYMASAMHDIGKIAIPDYVLNKEGLLDPVEMEIMKHHSDFGFELFKFSKRHLFQTATLIAHQHHEHWDGTGYPLGLKGEDIHLYARITAIADVFDALTCDRVYRKAWGLEETLAYFIEQKGKMFDPELTDLFLRDLDAYLDIREKHKD